MDTSKKYSLMCERAEEIQLIRREEHNSDTGKWKPGDFWTTVFNIDTDIAFVVPDYRDVWGGIPPYIHHPIECIWLPRQDQLQDMIGGWPAAGYIDWPDWKGFKYGFNYGNKPNGHLHIFNSGEQLWLAFVMLEKYNRKWDGGQWKPPA